MELDLYPIEIRVKDIKLLKNSSYSITFVM